MSLRTFKHFLKFKDFKGLSFSFLNSTTFKFRTNPDSECILTCSVQQGVQHPVQKTDILGRLINIGETLAVMKELQNQAKQRSGNDECFFFFPPLKQNITVSQYNCLNSHRATK